MQSDNLERLKALVFSGGWDEESREKVLALEKRLTKVAETERMKEMPGVRDWLAYLEAEISRCELLLKTKEDLTDLQRAKLFAIIQVASHYTRLFTGKERRDLEETIKRELDAATAL